MVLFGAWSVQIYYPRAGALKYARVAVIIYAGRLHTFSEVCFFTWYFQGEGFFYELAESNESSALTINHNMLSRIIYSEKSDVH